MWRNRRAAYPPMCSHLSMCSLPTHPSVLAQPHSVVSFACVRHRRDNKNQSLDHTATVCPNGALTAPVAPTATTFANRDNVEVPAVSCAWHDGSKIWWRPPAHAHNTLAENMARTHRDPSYSVSMSSVQLVAIPRVVIGCHGSGSHFRPGRSLRQSLSSDLTCLSSSSST